MDDLSDEAIEGLVGGKNKFKLMAESEDGTQKRNWLLQVRCDKQESLGEGDSLGGSLSGSTLRHRRNQSGSHSSHRLNESSPERDSGPPVASFKISMLVPFIVAAVLLWMLEPVEHEWDAEEPYFLSPKIRFWAAFLVGVVSSWMSLQALR